MQNSRPPYFPMLIDLASKHVLIIGGGHIASRRAETLKLCGAEITVISQNFCEEFPAISKKIIREFKTEDITKNFFLVIAATNNRETNRLVYETAKSKNIPVNIADVKNECDFFFPSFITHENIAASINTAGTSAKLTKILSDRLRSVWSSWVKEAQALL